MIPLEPGTEGGRSGANRLVGGDDVAPDGGDIRTVVAGGGASALARSLPALGLASIFVLLGLPLGSDPSVAEALAFAALSALAYAVLVVTLWPRIGVAFVDLVRPAPR